MKNITTNFIIPSISVLLGIYCLLSISLFSCKEDLDSVNPITTRSYSVDTVYILGTNYSTISTSPDEIEVTFSGNWEWKDNNGGTTWNPIETGRKIKVKCRCPLFMGYCGWWGAFPETGPQVITCQATTEGCDGEGCEVIIRGLANNDIPNGVTIRPQ